MSIFAFLPNSFLKVVLNVVTNFKVDTIKEKESSKICKQASTLPGWFGLDDDKYITESS